ncbi:hypothetical protein VTK73DRAFT_5804 [Phialemonium thermophilum]|uniref:Uncharacterized protein n=1 Tax=Phialemonium thermophilum TaxID=223376 RepID=A0ABR3WLM4_9PEZI
MSGLFRHFLPCGGLARTQAESFLSPFFRPQTRPHGDSYITINNSKQPQFRGFCSAWRLLLFCSRCLFQHAEERAFAVISAGPCIRRPGWYGGAVPVASTVGLVKNNRRSNSSHVPMTRLAQTAFLRLPGFDADQCDGCPQWAVPQVLRSCAVCAPRDPAGIARDPMQAIIRSYPA